MTESLPRETLSPLAASVERVLRVYEYDVSAAIEAIDDSVAGFGGLFDPGRTRRRGGARSRRGDAGATIRSTAAG